MVKLLIRDRERRRGESRVERLASFLNRVVTQEGRGNNTGRSLYRMDYHFAVSLASESHLSGRNEDEESVHDDQIDLNRFGRGCNHNTVD